MSNDELAFEYVLGTLRGEERKAFARRLETDTALLESVQFWQQQLMILQSPQTLAPQADTWARIEENLPRSSTPARRDASKFAFWRWPAVLASLLLFGIVLFAQQMKLQGVQSTPNTDYVAVLTSTQGEAKLTALTSIDGQKLWLRWSSPTLRPGYALQLWAVSKRDGEVRSLAVISQADLTEIALDTASSRLIQDAAELLLTEEEIGGSALDQPSDTLLARGICVRLRSG